MAAASAFPLALRKRRLFPREELVQPFRVDFAAQKIGFGEDAAEKAGVGFDSGDDVFVEGAAQAVQWFLRVNCPRRSTC